MKKVISLLLALTMLLSLTGVAVAATGGQLQDGNNTIELPWDSKEASVYTYTATQTGTLYIMATEFYCADESTDYNDNSDRMQEWAWYTQLTVNGKTLEGDYYGAVEVVEGQTYTFSWKHIVDEKWYVLGWSAVLNLSYSDELIPKAGTETMPVELSTEQCPAQSIEISAGATAYYLLYDFGGACFTVTGENAYVQVTSFDMMLGEEVVAIYEAEDGVVTVPVENHYTTIQIGNAGEESAVFTLDYYYPQGSRENPDTLVIGENVATTVADNYDGYYFTFTAECDGTLTLTFPESGWMYAVKNTTTNTLDVFCTYDSSGAENPLVVEVAKGDVLSINVNSYNGMTVPGGDVVFEASVSYDHDYVDGKCSHCGAEEVLYELGDVNGDGKVNARDARAILRHAAGLLGEGEINLDAADYNGDGRVNARDARAILRRAAGLE